MSTPGSVTVDSESEDEASTSLSSEDEASTSLASEDVDHALPAPEDIPDDSEESALGFKLYDPDWDSVVIYAIDPNLKKVCAVCRRQPPRDTLWRMCTCTRVLMHKACMEKYVQQRMISSCEACYRPFPIQWEQQYNVREAFWLWVTKHLYTFQLILILYLPILLVCETFLMYAFASNVMRKVVAASSQMTAKELLHNFSEEINYRYWTLLLVLVVFTLEVVFLGMLVSSNVVDFGTWYRGTSKATLLAPPVSDKQD